MARQTALSVLRTMLKAEIGNSLTVGVQRDTQYNTLLSNAQKWLSGEYDWPFLADMWDDAVPAGGKRRTLPSTARVKGANTAINTERPLNAALLYNGAWLQLEYGIGIEDFNAVDSDQGETENPIQRWQLAGSTEYEVWPPPTSASVVRLIGQRELPALSVDADKAELDDILIVMFCAAELLANAGAKNAQITLAKAQQRLARLRGSYSNRDRTYIVGSGGDRRTVRTVPIIAIHG